MQFLTKNEIRGMLEEFFEGLPNSSRILVTHDHDKEFIHIGQTVEYIKHEHQTYFIDLDKDTEHDKNIRQGNFSR